MSLGRTDHTPANTMRTQPAGVGCASDHHDAAGDGGGGDGDGDGRRFAQVELRRARLCATSFITREGVVGGGPAAPAAERGEQRHCDLPRRDVEFRPAPRFTIDRAALLAGALPTDEALPSDLARPMLEPPRSPPVAADPRAFDPRPAPTAPAQGDGALAGADAGDGLLDLATAAPPAFVPSSWVPVTGTGLVISSVAVASGARRRTRRRIALLLLAATILAPLATLVVLGALQNSFAA